MSAETDAEADVDRSLLATLELADWRRRISDLYTEVRALASTDVERALELWRTTREGLFREHPQSPVPADQRSSFRAQHFPHEPSLRFEVAIVPDEVRADVSPMGGGLPGLGASLAMDLPVSAGGTMAFRRIGRAEVPFSSGLRSLGVYWMAGYSGGVFLPFRDATSGNETYAAGRYLLDAAKSADLGGDPVSGTLIFDFNFAFQPSCAFDPRWACPLAPPENRLDIPILAGERLA